MNHDLPEIDRELLDEARAQMGPSSQQRSALKRTLLIGVAASTAMGSTTTASAAILSSTGAVIAKWSVAVALVSASVIGVSMVRNARHEERRANERAHVASPEMVPADTTSVREQLPSEAVPTPLPPVELERPTAPRSRAASDLTPRAPASLEPTSQVLQPLPVSADSLAAETGLLREVHAALARNDSSAALALLDEHNRRFPGGVLAEESAALHALTLCESGAVESGRVEAELFARRHPASPQLARLRRACGNRD